jgi:hypothetical protein
MAVDLLAASCLMDLCRPAQDIRKLRLFPPSVDVFGALDIRVGFPYFWAFDQASGDLQAFLSCPGC